MSSINERFTRLLLTLLNSSRHKFGLWTNCNLRETLTCEFQFQRQIKKIKHRHCNGSLLKFRCLTVWNLIAQAIFYKLALRCFLKNRPHWPAQHIYPLLCNILDDALLAEPSCPWQKKWKELFDFLTFSSESVMHKILEVSHEICGTICFSLSLSLCVCVCVCLCLSLCVSLCVCLSLTL